ncbi:universal stress protein [Planococcus sp. ISL-109]|uniref:universal stress protein n=1 Tax=Planococcus sp. ISL-109 TaxID=2819166 RepID=UPI001BE7743E|nr:universal stress protein [Planococcus sp. ISL-109]MBT2584016.1 universal stress protein [Planococcus sp. ISL-109]
MYRNLLVAMDGSEHSKRAAEEAIKLVKETPDAEVTIVYAIDYDKAEKEISKGQTNEQVATARREFLAPLEDLFQREGITSKTVVLNGSPAPAIIDHANEHSYDAVVIGSRGLNPVQQFVLGSVSHKVVKRVKAPVLIVK